MKSPLPVLLAGELIAGSTATGVGSDTMVHHRQSLPDRLVAVRGKP